ncbi:YeiH family protein [Microbacterium kyungheense]|uniref:Putative integral membrane protein (TIGR00698 family) n=1 Tax=Microbacterium kyungheense TaxID=1263636 RepID=A0A543FJ79_9MICO|nr:putative sulfate exporter family transporter [Microbacterium kyungheense]TQM33822.1 putative integral membrane protein (TIGR00698 family) [Microbacterium kyungheense]
MPHAVPLARRTAAVVPGVLLCVAIAAASLAVGRTAPVVGTALPAIAIGVSVAAIRRPGARTQPGIAFSGKWLLQVAVVLLGAQLSLQDVVAVGAESLPVMLSTLTVCLVAAWGLGRAMRIDGRLRTLIGVGTGICGASAIAAVAPVIAATSGEIAYAVSTIFVFNIAAAVAFPLLGHALGLDAHAFGLLAGTAINDTSSVVAAATTFGAGALGFAVVVKLVRTLMIVPISVGLALRQPRPGEGGLLRHPWRIATLVPWFIVGFVVMTLANTAGLIAEPVRAGLLAVSGVLIAAALAGIGLSTDLGAIRRAGWRPLALGAVLSLLVTATALVALAFTGRLA